MKVARWFGSIKDRVSGARINGAWAIAAAFASAGLGFGAGLGLGPDVKALQTRIGSKVDRTLDRVFPEPPPGVEGWVAEPGFKQEIHARGLNYPSRIAFVPKPGSDPDANFYYVAELAGRIRLVTRKGTVLTVVDKLLNYEWKPMDELGIIGLDVDPSLDRLYIALTYWDDAHGVYRNRVDTLTLSPDGRSTTGRTTLLDMKGEATVASYQVQFVALGPDANLYVGVGSGGHQADALNPARFAGKILRMDKQGKALATNPFYDESAPESAPSYTYALGLRNPFDIEWDPNSGIAVVSDVGPALDRIVRLERGANYCFGAGPEGNDSMRANALFTWGPIDNHAPTGLAIVPDALFKGGATSSLFTGIFGPVHMPGPNAGKRVSRFGFEAAGRLTSGPRIVTRYSGKYYASVSDVDLGPDGVYFAEIYGEGELPHVGEGRVYRLVSDGRGLDTAGARPVLASGSAEELFTLAGCGACHDLKPGESKKEGPSLEGLGDRLDSRLNSADYEHELDELSRRDSEYFVRQRPSYEALRRTSGRERVKLWFKQHLADPRFDNPNAKMPAFGHLPPKSVDALTDWLIR